MTHKLHYDLEYWNYEENVARISKEISKFSSDWIPEVQCNLIQSDAREFYDDVVYFGSSKKELSDGELADEINHLAMSDLHRFGGKTKFFYNLDPNCRRQYNLDPQKKYVGFFLAGATEPKFVEMDEDITAEMLDRVLTDQIVKLRPFWGTRSGHAIASYNRFGIVFFLEEGVSLNLTPENIEKDWRLQLFVSL